MKTHLSCSYIKWFASLISNCWPNLNVRGRLCGELITNLLISFALHRQRLKSIVSTTKMVGLPESNYFKQSAPLSINISWLPGSLWEDRSISRLFMFFLTIGSESFSVQCSEKKIKLCGISKFLRKEKLLTQSLNGTIHSFKLSLSYGQCCKTFKSQN